MSLKFLKLEHSQDAIYARLQLNSMLDSSTPLELSASYEKSLPDPNTTA